MDKEMEELQEQWARLWEKDRWSCMEAMQRTGSLSFVNERVLFRVLISTAKELIKTEELNTL